jgi:hypothetical protein
MYEAILDVGFILGPVVGFIPQIYRGKPTYNPGLSVLTILSSLLKLFSHKSSGFDSILQYQFCVVILVHLYLIRLHAQQKGQDARSFLGPVHSHRWYHRYVVPLAGLFVASLKLLDFLGLGYLFTPASVVMDLVITLLHLDLYSSKEPRPKELFAVWLVGDAIRLVMMFRKYSTPVEVLFGTLVQIVINLALLLAF